jgi:hypothetical protein
MIRSKYFYLTVIILSVSTVSAFFLPLGLTMCPWLNCRHGASANLDFFSAPERKLMMFPSPEGLSTIPPPWLQVRQDLLVFSGCNPLALGSFLRGQWMKDERHSLLACTVMLSECQPEPRACRHCQPG